MASLSLSQSERFGHMISLYFQKALWFPSNPKPSAPTHVKMSYPYFFSLLLFFETRQDTCPAFLCIIALLFCIYNLVSPCFYIHLINYKPISHNGIGTNRITPLFYCIPGVSFYGIDGCSITALHDSYMVARSIVVPIKKDDRTGTWHTPSPLTFSLVLEPVLSIRTKGKLGNCTTLDQSCLVGTPGHKAGTPFLPAVKSIP